MRRLHLAPALAAAALALGCSSQEAATVRAELRASPAVTGTRLVTYWTGAGQVTVPAPDLFEVEIAAIAPAAGGGATRAPAVVSPDGSFRIEGVPAGRYLLEIVDPGAGTRTLVDTAERELDLGWDELGRPGWATATEPVALTFDLTGLAPWGADDQLQLSGAGWDVPSDYVEVAEGATTFSGTMDWWMKLADTGAGDRLWVHQLSGAYDPAVPGVRYQRATRAAELADVVMVDGGAQLLAAELQPAPQTGALEVAWATTAFEAHLAEMSPAAAPFLHTILVDATSGPLAYPSPQPEFGWPDLLVVNAPPGTPDFTARSTYGQFLPRGTSEFRYAFFQVWVPFLAPGASTPRGLAASVVVVEPAPGAAALAPVVTPVRAPRIAGVDAFAPQAGVGTTPLLSWEAPAVGAPTSYQVLLYRLQASPTGATRLVRVATLTTTRTSVRFPPGVLEPGTTYAAKISAWQLSGAQPESAPLRLGYDRASADAVTATFSP